MLQSNASVGVYPFDSFGPTQQNAFDFTPLFEDTILSIAPSTIFLLALPVRLLILQK